MAFSPVKPFQTDAKLAGDLPAHQVGTGEQPKTAPPGGSGAGGSGSGSDSSNPTNLPADWYKAFFQNYGLPPDVQQSVMDVLTKYASDPTTAQALATQYLRSTDWFQKTFPGFNEGVRNGLFTDENGYRSYLNAYNGQYNQYLGRHITGDEASALFGEGVSPTTLGQRFQGQAYINANQPDIQYLAGAFGGGRLNGQQLTALGNESAGIDTQMGQLQQKILQKAQQVRDKLFTGTLATPNMTLGPSGVSAPALLGTHQTPDIHA